MVAFKCEECGTKWYSSSDEWTTCDNCGGTLHLDNGRLSEDE